jgi:hypothetical protein
MGAGSPIAKFVKDPDSELDYTVDWGTWLPTGDTISTSAWTIIPGGLTESTGMPSTNTNTTATITVTSGTAGVDYSLINRITTAGGRITDRTIRINVRER